MELSDSLQGYFSLLSGVEEFLWTYFGVPLIIILGSYFSWKSRFIQIRKFPFVVSRFFRYMSLDGTGKEGVHPLKAFFASVGGCIGIGNIVGVCTAIKVGGPGALFWLWVTALAGMMFKYAEVYLGIRFREHCPKGGFRGGPMYYLKQIFKGPFFPTLSAFLLCIYGVEIYQFRIVTQSITENFQINEYIVIFVLLFLVIAASSGGVRRVGSISSVIIPFFVIIYVSMGLWVLIMTIDTFPARLYDVLTSAFTGHAALGGFIGSTLMMAMSQGVRRGAYTGDVGIGYSSVIESQTLLTCPQKQASLVIFAMFLDTFVICTMTIFIILQTGVWSTSTPASMMVQTALETYFPYMEFFMPLFLFLLGYSTINAYFVVGLTCADYLSPKIGKKVFYLYAVSVLLLFSFSEPTEALSLMAIVGCLLLIINSYAIFKLRNEVDFHF